MKQVLFSVIRFYQKFISPCKPPCCRFYPTCSSYAYEAISRFGAWRGGLLALWRILRCGPWNRGGYDPVPQRFTFRRVRRQENENEKPTV